MMSAITLVNNTATASIVVSVRSMNKVSAPQKSVIPHISPVLALPKDTSSYGMPDWNPQNTMPPKMPTISPMIHPSKVSPIMPEVSDDLMSGIIRRFMRTKVVTTTTTQSQRNSCDVINYFFEVMVMCSDVESREANLFILTLCVKSIYSCDIKTPHQRVMKRLQELFFGYETILYPNPLIVSMSSLPSFFLKLAM